jgi:phosphatidylserine/phosphatidylglycerophosphate/cardiolipin synthase-like enzyme
MKKLAVALLSVAVMTTACHKKDNTAIQTVNSGQTVVTYYSPQTNLEKIDEDWLKMSKIPKKLYIAMYAFTDKNLANEIIQLANDGVEVYIYRDSEQMNDKGDTTEMFKGVKNIHIKAKNDRSSSNIMHDKIFIVPGVVFREGSANWSPSAEGAVCSHKGCDPSRNQDNNATYITDKVEILKAEKVFWEMWNREDNIVIQ